VPVKNLPLKEAARIQPPNRGKGHGAWGIEKNIADFGLRIKKQGVRRQKTDDGRQRTASKTQKSEIRGQGKTDL
jgi:hypothetical protein